MRSSVLQKTSAKKSITGLIDGPAMAAMIKFIVGSANENRFPQLPSLWNSWATQLVDQALEDAFAFYKREMDKLIKGSEPAPEKEFPKMHRTVVQQTTELFKELLFNFQHLYEPKMGKLEVNEKHLSYLLKLFRTKSRINSIPMKNTTGIEFGN